MTKCEIQLTEVLPGSRSTNDFYSQIQIRWKLRLAVIPLLALRSLNIFTHATAAQLSCHVQNFVVITMLESRESETKFPSNLNCNGKTVTETGPSPTSFDLVLVTILACFISIRWTSHMYHTPGCLTEFRSGHHISSVLNTGCELRCSIIIPVISTKILPDRGVGPNCRDIPSCRYITDSAWNKCIFWTNVSCGIFKVNPIKPTQYTPASGFLCFVFVMISVIHGFMVFMSPCSSGLLHWHLTCNIFLQNHKRAFTISIFPAHWHHTGSWNPFSCKTTTYLLYIVNNMVADALVSCIARVSAIMLLT